MRETWWRWSGSAGLLFVTVALASAAVQGRVPTYADSGQVITVWFRHSSQQYLIGQFVSGLGFLLFYLPFLAGLCAVLHGAEGRCGVWWRVAFAGGILFPAAGIAGGILLSGLALVAGDVPPQVARLVVAAGSYGIGVSGALSATLMGATAVVIVRTGVFGAWLARLGSGMAVAAVLGSAAIVEVDAGGPIATIGSVAWLGFFVWTVGVSVALLRRTSLPVPTIADPDFVGLC